ncbi:helix-turn-helix domain-containing protein [Reichenbachiella carrageenanivorans]|uniref:Helix-turn-helix domain-containing protein n=1 Tax=Reichenbachiella carrageenanivorans TaxID=2979869 RepID=A0ABY6CXY2_9BACT|nr:helix-turn-helix domain-containing protein [Reichenbachiella carrageenanivorans]UXX78771.1 helix-turn-helix domain-containing protein [Reichenbachiella carrageenanivorans]
MNYKTYKPHPNLDALVKCHWILEVPHNTEATKQRIVPDGCIEMCFILGDDVKRYTSETEYIIQPRSMVFGQITKPYYIQPTGYVNTFAVRFYPYGFANFISRPISELADKETPLISLFNESSAIELERAIIEAASTQSRIEIIENFLLSKFTDPSVIDNIVQSTIKTLNSTKGNSPINSILKHDLSKRRSLERKFSKQVGISPKQLGKIIRLQAALKSILNNTEEKLTQVAYENKYYDQAHFIKDFKEFTGTNPKEYLNDEQMILSSLIYSKD